MATTPRREHGARTGVPYVLVLREHDDPGRGYSLELAPLPGGGTTPRAHRREAATATATATGTPPRARGGSSRTEAATGRAPRGRGGGMEAGPPLTPWRPFSRGRDEAVDAVTGGGSTSTAGALGDAAGGGGEYDPAAGARECILQDMRNLVFPPIQSDISPEKLPRIGAPDAKSSSSGSKNVREVLIPVFLSPRKKVNNKKEDVWNKRQLLYGIALLGPLGFAPAIVAFLPQWAVFSFTFLWGLGSFGFPMGLYGNPGFDTGYSRHMARLIFMGFSMLVIYVMYRSMALTTGTSSPSSPSSAPVVSPAPSADNQNGTNVDMLWTAAYGILGVVVMGGHVISWIRGCMSGNDRDEESEASGEEDVITSDLLQRLLDV